MDRLIYLRIPYSLYIILFIFIINDRKNELLQFRSKKHDENYLFYYYPWTR